MSAHSVLAATLRACADAVEALDRPATQEPQDGAVSVRAAANSLGVSLTTIYDLVKRDELKALRVGRAVRIPAGELESFRRRRTR